MSFINKDYDISISEIDYKQLNYQDINWIYSEHMIKFIDEFEKLPGFRRYTYKLYLLHYFNILLKIYDTFKYKQINWCNDILLNINIFYRTIINKTFFKKSP